MSTVSDDFQRASSADLGTNWTPQTGGSGGLACRIINNADATWDAAAGTSAEFWNANTFGLSQFAEITLGSVLETLTTDIANGAYACVRMSSGGATTEKYYVVARVGQLLVLKMDLAGGRAQLGSTFSGTVSVGDVIRIEAVNAGSDVVLTVKQNGTQRIQVTDTAPGVPYTTNFRVGIGGTIANDVSTVAAWAGGDLGAGVSALDADYLIYQVVQP